MKLLRVKEAAELMGVKPASIRQLERRGLLHSVRDWAFHRRFTQSEVERVRVRLLSGELSPKSGGKQRAISEK